MKTVQTKRSLFGVSIFAALIVFCVLNFAPLRLLSQGTHSITVRWTTPTTGGAPTTYNVKRSTTTGAEVKIATVNVPNLSYVDTNGVAGTTYFYVISAQNQFGESPNSNEVSASFLGDSPGIPGGVTATAQ